MTGKLDGRVRALELRRAAEGSTTSGGWTVADWLRAAEARRGLEPEAWLRVMLRDELPRWPEDRRESMARQWAQTVELERMIADGLFGEGA